MMGRKHTPTEIIQFCCKIQELCNLYGCYCYFKSYDGTPGGRTLSLDQVRVLRSSDLRGGIIHVKFSGESESWGIWVSHIHMFSENLEEEFLSAMLERTFNP